MNDSLRQETLALYHRVGKTFDQFIVGTNAEATDRVRAWAAGDGPWFIVLWGAKAVGKSHLLQASLRGIDHVGDSTMYAPLKMLSPHGKQTIGGLEGVSAIGIDDVDTVIGDKSWETALFSLFNTALEKKQRLLVTSRQNPRNLIFALPDLQSRLCSGLSYPLFDLDDQQKQAYLVARATQNDTQISDAVAEYIVSRYGRDLHSLSALYERLDAASLRAGRHLTIPFIKEILR